MLKHFFLLTFLLALFGIARAQIPDSTAKPDYDVAPWPLEGFAPAPQYPEMAIAAEVYGKVVAEIRIDDTGHVTDYSAHGDPKGLGFENEVEKAVRKWKFSPARRGRKAVDCRIQLTWLFRLTYEKGPDTTQWRLHMRRNLAAKAAADSISTMIEELNKHRELDPKHLYSPLLVVKKVEYITPRKVIPLDVRKPGD